MAVAVSAGSSCFTATNPATNAGSIRGVVSNSLGGGISGATVSVTADSGGQFVATTDTGGNFLITKVPDGDGILGLSGLASSCTTPAPVSYAVVATDTTELQIVVTCVVTLP
jgi:hypothetical protein